MVGTLKLFHLPFGVVIDNNTERMQYGHYPWSPFIKVFPDAILQQGYINHALPFGHADEFTKFPDSLRCVSPSSEAGNGGHSWIIPATDIPFFH